MNDLKDNLLRSGFSILFLVLYPTFELNEFTDFLNSVPLLPLSLLSDTLDQLSSSLFFWGGGV